MLLPYRSTVGQHKSESNWVFSPVTHFLCNQPLLFRNKRLLSVLTQNRCTTGISPIELVLFLFLSELSTGCSCLCDLWIYHSEKTGFASSYHPLPTIRNYLVAYARTLTLLNLFGGSTQKYYRTAGDPRRGLSRSRAGVRYPFMNSLFLSSQSPLHFYVGIGNLWVEVLRVHDPKAYPVTLSSDASTHTDQ